MEETLLKKIKSFEKELIDIRRDIHQHPEIAFEEKRTAKLVADYMEKLGIEVERNIGNTGLVGTLKGNIPGERVIGLRADMDALCIQEASDLNYRSLVEGKMHACGHDGHVAMLLGAARYLSENRDFSGTVRFIFQPGEEGHGGAKVMMEDGLFDRFPCDAVYAIHGMPGAEAGSFGIRSGAVMAAADTWMVTFKGTGGHGAMPSMGTDPYMPVAQFITTLQTIVSRNVPPTKESVISIGHVNGGMFESPNIIPAEVIVRGTARCYDPEIRDLMEKRIGELAQHCAAAFDCQAELDYQRRYPPLSNWNEQTQIAIQAATAVSGAEKVDTSIPKVTGSEDFAFMLEKVPGAYIMLSGGEGPFIHTPLYDFNDDIIATGVAYWATLVKLELPAK